MSDFTHFDVTRVNDVTEIRLADPGLFETEHYAELRRELVEFVEQNTPRKLLVLFSRVKYCSTALVSALLLVKDRVESEHGSLKLSDMNDTAREVFSPAQFSQGMGSSAFEIDRSASKRVLHSEQTYS